MPSNAEERVSDFISSLYISEPLYQRIALSHRWICDANVETVAVGKRKIRYNPNFIDTLKPIELKEVVFTELDRILLKHPYERVRPNRTALWLGSSAAINEHTGHAQGQWNVSEMHKYLVKEGYTTDQKKYMKLYDKLMSLPEEELKAKTGYTREKLAMMRDGIQIPNLNDMKKRSMEYYYHWLDKNMPALSFAVGLIVGDDGDENKKGNNQNGKQSGEGKDGNGDPGENGSNSEKSKDLKDKVRPKNPGKLTEDWEEDSLTISDINTQIREAQITNQWGSVGGDFKDQLLASLNPKVDYKAILRHFRQTVYNSEYISNRMRPNRRYGFGFPGRKHECTTSVAFFIDTSGSVSDKALSDCLGTINKIFRTGVKNIDVRFFDAKLQNEKPIKVKHVKGNYTVTGRGGTDFQVVFDFLATAKTKYDGVIVFTDGWCDRPDPKGFDLRKVCWLIDCENNYESTKDTLKGLGNIAFVHGKDEVV